MKAVKWFATILAFLVTGATAWAIISMDLPAGFWLVVVFQGVVSVRTLRNMLTNNWNY